MNFAITSVANLQIFLISAISSTHPQELQPRKQGEIHMANLKNNDMAVSPIVATLVLIVVAVIGAVAVGTIMGTFSSDVSKQANSGNAASQAQTELLVAGSTTVYPVTLNLATDYEAAHPGIKIVAQQGGSGAGVTSAALGIADIGATSTIHSITDAQTANPTDLRYTNLQYSQIGGSAVVWVTNTATPGAVSPVAAADVKAAYLEGVGATGTAAAHGSINKGAVMLTREAGSGTLETAATWAYGGAVTKAFPAGAVGTVDNSGMLAAVQTTANGVGFLDYGYSVGASGITVLTVSDKSSDGNTYTYTASSTTVKNDLKDMYHNLAQDTTAGGPTKAATGGYPLGLARGLYYVTEGTPSSVISDFINYARTPTAAANDFDKANVFGITEFA
jgi:phosphate transport system substrate-binding protein